jgi:leucyl-tRNA synthetase
LRYPSVGLENSKIPWAPEVTRQWLPVDAYIGGAEHAVLQLMYSRFVWMALQDWGYLPKELGDEPFPFLYGHGLIIKDGAKMSKSRGNVVIPDKYIDKYGVDALRMYLMFLGPYDQGGDFRDTGMVGMRRFLERIWQLFEKCQEQNEKSQKETTPRLKRKLQQTIKKVGDDVGKFKYNTAIAALMELVNVWKKEGEGLSQEDAAKFLKLLALFAPYLSEELWFRLGKEFSIHQQRWPDYDADLARGELVTVVVQVNGKLRARLELERKTAKDKKAVLSLAKKHERVQQYIAGKKISKEIFVPGKLVNLVVK